MLETLSGTDYRGLLCHTQELQGILWVTKPQKRIFQQKVIRTRRHPFHLFIKHISSTKYCAEIGDIKKSFHFSGGKNQINQQLEKNRVTPGQRCGQDDTQHRGLGTG